MSMFKRSLAGLPKTSNLSKLRSVFLTKTDITVLLEPLELEESCIERDTFSAFWELNTWCALFQDLTHQDGSLLATRLRFGGLKRTIEEADSARLEFFRTGKTVNEFWNSVFPEFVPECTTVLGFPRRMRLTGKRPSSEYEVFLQGNVKCRNHNLHFIDPKTGSVYYQLFDPEGKLSQEEWGKTHTFTPGFILDYMAEIIGCIFSDWKRDDSLFILPPGATVEGAHTYLEKFNIVCEQQIWLRERGVIFPYPLPYAKSSVPKDCCKYQLVPKSFKALRGISPEPVSKQVLGYQIDAGLRKCLCEFSCDLSDQTRNQEFSRDLENATADSSNASDSISLFLVKATFSKVPEELQRLLMEIRSSRVQVDKNVIHNYRFATMGNACTFSIESAIFLAAALTAIIIQDGIILNSRNIKRTIKKLAKLIAVYGDDVVLPSEYFETFCIVMDKLGFTINREKSYSAPCLYRESCGKEWYAGEDVTPTILSRGLSKIPLAELVSLQHKLVEYPTANAFLCSVILEVFPDITTSSVGSPYHDIWYDSPLISHKGCSPYSRVVDSIDLLVRRLIKDDTFLLKRDREPSWFSVTFDWNDLIRRFPMFLPFKRDYKNVSVLSWICNSLKANTDPAVEILKVDDRSLRTHFEKVDPPHDENREFHTCITSVAGGKVPAAEKEKVELLAYLLWLGRGIEHVNNSPFTKDEDHILDRRDLCHKRKIKIKNELIAD